MKNEYQRLYNTRVKDDIAAYNRHVAENAMANSEYKKNVAIIENLDMARRKRAVAYPIFKKSVQESFVAGFLGTLCQKALSEAHVTSDLNEAIGICNATINRYVHENGAMNLIRTMNGKTLFLSEAAKLLDETIDSVLEETDPRNPETYVIDPDKELEFYDSLEDSDTVDDITNTIRMRVVDAEEKMATDNIGDKIDMDQIVRDAKERIEAVRNSNASGDTTDDSAEIQQQEAVSISKVRMNKVSTNRPRSVLEQMVRTNSKAVMKDKALNEAYTNNGQIDFERLMNSTIAVYTVMECLNTIGLEDYTTMDIQHIVSA